MIAREADDRLRDIRDAAADLLDFMANIEDPEFHALPDADRMAFRAIKNAITEMGDALKSLPAEVIVRHPEVDWKGFAGLRDIVVHQYFGLDTKRLLPIIRDEVPGLLAAVEAELGPVPGRNPVEGLDEPR